MAEERILRLRIDPTGVERGERRARGALNRLGRNAQTTETRVDGITRAFRALGVVASLEGLRRGAIALFDIGSAAEETRNKFDTVFGAQSGAVSGFLDEFAVKAGLARTEAEDLTSTVGAVVQGFGFAQAESAKLAREVVKLGGDFASFNNLPTEESINAIISALAGENERIKRFGVVLRENDVIRRALNDTRKESVSLLTEQERTLARLALITEKAGVSIGDLDRTQDSAANTARRLGAQLDDLKRSAAELLLPGLSRGLAAVERHFLTLTDAAIGLTFALAGAGGLVVAMKALNVAVAGFAATGAARAFIALLPAIKSVRDAMILAGVAATGLRAAMFGPAGVVLAIGAVTAATIAYRRAVRDSNDAARTQVEITRQQGIELARLTGTQLLALEAQTRSEIATLESALATSAGKGIAVEIEAKLTNRQGVLQTIEQIRGRLAELQSIPGVEIVVDGADKAADAILTVAKAIEDLKRSITESKIRDLAEQFVALKDGALSATGPIAGIVPPDPTIRTPITRGIETGGGVQPISGFEGFVQDAKNFFRRNINLKDALSTAAGNLISGGVSSLIGGAVNFIGGLFTESPEERQRQLVTESNTAALDRLTRGIADLGAAIGTTPGGVFGGIEEALESALGASTGNRLIDQAFIPLEFRRQLEEMGISFEQAATLADAFDISLNDTVGSLEDFQTALKTNFLEQFFGSFEGQSDLLRRRFELLDIEDPNAQIRDLQSLLVSQTTGTLQDQLRDLDFTNPDALLSGILDQLAAGTFDFTQLGDELGITDFLDLIGELERLGDAAGDSASALNEVSRILNAPSGFKVELERFLASDPVNPATLTTTDASSPTVFDPTVIGGGGGEGAIRFTGTVFNVNIDAGNRSPEELWEGIEQVIIDRATQGGVQPIETALRGPSGTVLT